MNENSLYGDNGRIRRDLESLSNETVSFIASLAIGFLLCAPAIMAVLSSFKRSVDYTVMLYLAMIKNLVFPFACSLVFLIYIIIIIRLQKQGVKPLNILKKNPLFIIFALTVIWMLGSQFYNGADYAFSSYAVNEMGETFGMELSYIVFILFAGSQVKVEKHKRFLVRIEVMASLMVVVSAFILWHTQKDSQLFVNWADREDRLYFCSIFANINYYGYYLSIAVPVSGAAFIYEKVSDKNGLVWKILSGFSFIANTVALSLADSLGSWIGAGFAVLFILVAHLIIEKRINIQAIILIPVFCVCLYIPGHITGTFENSLQSLSTDVVDIVTNEEAAKNAGSGRWSLWKESIEVIMKNKIYGVGFEGAMFLPPEECPTNVRPHNEYIQYAMFHGIPTVIFYIIGCFGIFLRALRKRKIMNGATLVALAGALGYLVGSFFGLTVFSTAYLLFVFLGMGYINDEIVNLN